MASEKHDPVAFPVLTEAEMACLADLGELRRFRDGELLLEYGQKDYSFFAIKAGPSPSWTRRPTRPAKS